MALAKSETHRGRRMIIKKKSESEREYPIKCRLKQNLFIYSQISKQ